MKRFVLAAAAVLGMWAGPAGAAPVQLNYAASGYPYDVSTRVGINATVLYDPSIVPVAGQTLPVSLNGGLLTFNGVGVGSTASNGYLSISNNEGLNVSIGDELLNFTVSGTGASGTALINLSRVTQLGDNYGLDSQINSSVGFVEHSNVFVTPVPEASTWAMMMVGLGVAGGALRRRRRASVHFSLA